MINFQPYCVYLECSYAATSDFAYVWIGFRSTRYGFSIWAGDGDDIRGRVAALNKPYSWRAAATRLLDLEEGYADEENLYDIRVTGESGWRAELLALCWVQQDQIRSKTKKFLLALDDNVLERLATNLGSLISKNSLDLFGRYLELESINPLECWSKTFPENPKFSIKKLVSDLEKKASRKAHEAKRARKVLLEPFRSAIDQIIHENRTSWERFGPFGAMGTSIFRGNFVSRLEEFVICHSRLPDGDEMLMIKSRLGKSDWP